MDETLLNYLENIIKLDQLQDAIDQDLSQTSKTITALKLVLLDYSRQAQEFEKVWRGLFIFIGVVFCYMSYQVYEYRSLDYFKSKPYGPKGDFLKFIGIGIIITVFYLITDQIWHKIADSWVEKNFLTLKRYATPEQRAKRSYTIAKWGYFIMYYFGTSVVGYYLILHTQYLPEFLGGSGSFFTLIENRQLKEGNYLMELYYSVQFGKHLGRFIAHIFIRAEGNYYEYCLHHALSLYLICFSYAINFWYIGIFVLIVHDYTDFALIIGRSYKDYRHKKEFLLYIAYVHAIGSWIALRVFLFSYACVYSTIYQALEWTQIMQENIQMRENEQGIGMCYFFIIFMLSCLEFMHLYWTYYIYNSAVEVYSNEKIIKHNYD